MGTRTTRATTRSHANASRLRRAATLAAAAALFTVARSQPAFATVSTWRGFTGNWTTGNNWSNTDLFGGYPNNGNGGHNFDVVLNSGTATLDAPITVDTLVFGGGIITGTNTLTLTQGGSWTDGKFGGGGNFVVQNGLHLAGAIKRLRGNLTVSGDSNWTSGDIEVSLHFIGDDEFAHSLLTNNGTLRINTDSDIAGADPIEGRVVNNGLMIKESGGGVTEVMAGFTNNGTVTANAGTIQFDYGGTHTGRFTGTGTLDFQRNHTFTPTASVAANTVTFDFSGASVVNTPNFSAATLNISNATVLFNSSPTLGAVNLAQFATLGGTATVNIPGLLTWSSGDMADAGITIINGGAEFTTTGGKGLGSGRQLHNNTVANWTGGNFANAGDAVFLNSDTGTLNVRTDSTFAGGTFKNSGLVVKNAGAGVTTFAGTFLNNGTVRTDTGTLSFDGGGNHTGTFANGAAAVGTVLRFGGGVHTFAPGSVVNHPHVVFSGGSADLNGTFVIPVGQQVDVSGATVNVNAPGAMSPATLNVSLGTLNLANGATHHPGTLNLSGGTIQGGDNVSVATALNWSGGGFTGAGQVTAPALAISGDAAKTLGGTRQFTNNSAAATWQGNGSIQAGDNTLFTNPTPGRLTLLSDADYLGGTFNNLGQVTKSGGTGTSSFTGTFYNSGTVNVLNGTLSLEGAGNHTGTFNGTAGASSTLRLAGDLMFTGSSHILGPNVDVAGGTSDVVGQYALPASRTTTVSGGMLKLHNGPLPQFGNALNLSGGTLDLQIPGSNADFTATTLNLSAGVYQGTNSVTFGAINFSGGTLQGGGTVRAQALAITSGNPKQIVGNRQLLNLGAASYWDGAGEFDNADTATFTNSNTFEIRNASTFSGGTFDNFASMSKTSAGVTTIAVSAFNNTGTLTVAAGELRIQGPGTDSGTLDGQGLLRLAAGTHTFTDTSALAVRDVIIESSTVRSQGQWTPRNTTVSSGSLTLAGPQPYPVDSTLAANGGVVDLNTDAGTPAARRLAVSASGGTVNFNTTQHLRSLAATAGAHVNLVDDASPVPTRIVTNNLSVAPLGAFVDLRNNALIVDYDAMSASPLSDVRARIFSAFDPAATNHWTGPGITSSTAAGKAGGAVGYAEASAVLGPAGGNFLGEDVDGSAVVVRYTLNGDANLDGTVDFNDLVALAQHYNTSAGQLWSGGDFTYDGNINFADLVLLAQNYNTSLPSAAAGLPDGFVRELDRAAAEVPEPSLAGAILTVIAAPLSSRRRRGLAPANI
jgi:hypothetical protein